MKKPVVLTIIDGLGLCQKIEGNAWKQAKTPTLDFLLKDYPNSVLEASGPSVGLPNNQIGNSEVGHLNIGAGQIVYTGLSLIQKALDDNSFLENKAFLKSIDYAQKNNGTVHVMGLLSPGGVHSLEEHAFKILDLLFINKVKNVTFHAFTDGRDVAPKSVKQSLKKLNNILEKYNYKLGSIAGRLYAMDRDSMFEKTELAFNMLQGFCEKTFKDPLSYIDMQYQKNLNDEFIECAINSDENVNFLKDNDAVIFFNFRPDRARQLAHCIVGSELYDFKPKHFLKNIQLTSIMKYEKIDKADIAFDSMHVENTLGKVISENKLTQLRIAETQKYAHVTFFMDGGKDVSYEGSKRILVPSAKVDNFSTVPEMSAKSITDSLVPELGNFDLVIMNYANPDMVGHTGNMESTIKAIEIIDEEILKLKTAVDKLGGTMFITSDHGNAEIMIEDGKPATKHTISNVPFIITNKNVKLKKNGSLSNIAPTVLDYMKINKPKSMDHESLIK